MKNRCDKCDKPVSEVGRVNNMIVKGIPMNLCKFCRKKLTPVSSLSTKISNPQDRYMERD
jgi:hypothetical protein